MDFCQVLKVPVQAETKPDKHLARDIPHFSTSCFLNVAPKVEFPLKCKESFHIKV